SGAENIFGTYNVDDYYLFGRGDGNDVIIDNPNGFSRSEERRVGKESDVAPSEVTLSQTSNSSHLVLSINGTADKVTLQNWFASPVYQVEKVQFGDGTVWDTSVLSKAARSGWFAGNSGAENIFGSYNVDDYYLFGRGDGNDVIIDNPNGFSSTSGDTLIFRPDVAPSDITISRPNGSYDVDFSINGTSDKVTLQNAFASPVYQVEKIQFAGGVVFEPTNFVFGTSGVDSLSGTVGNDALEAGCGDESLAGGAGNEYLAGGSGADALAG